MKTKKVKKTMKDKFIHRYLLWVSLVLFFVPSQTLLAQKTVIIGTVTEAPGKIALPGVNVIEKGTSNGIATDVNGKYQITLSSPKAELIFSYLGYKSITISPNGRTTINVTLEPDATLIDEVVVVGFGSQKKVSLSASVGTADGKVLENRATPTALTGLQGTIPGLTIVQKSSQPGNPQTTYRIRGEGTWGNNEPLILIDGVPGGYDLINPEDVESVSVLKDAASAAIYGVRASAGVILITTKSGGRNKPVSLNYSGYVGVQTTTRNPEFLGSGEYVQLSNEARRNVGETPIYSDETVQSILNGTANPYEYANTDWVKEIYKNAAMTHSHNVSMEGGNQKMGFFASYGYLSQDGIVISNKYKSERHNLRTKINADVLKDRLSVEANLSYIAGENNSPIGGNNNIYNALKQKPVTPIRNEAGNYMIGIGDINPIAAMELGGDANAIYNDIMITGSATLKIMEGLKAKGTYSSYRNNTRYKNFTKKFSYYDKDNNFSKYNTKDAILWEQSVLNRSNSVIAQLDFDRSFGDHHVAAVLGFTQDWGCWEDFSAQKQEFATNQLEILNAGQSNATVGGYANHFALRSGFFRANYNYKYKYFVEFVIRRDLTSRFAKENRVGYFPAGSAAWRFTEENFMKWIKENVINEGKIRFSYGLLGNQNVGSSLYPYMVEIPKFSNIWPLGNQETSGYGQTILPNKNIKWETSHMVNYGLDLAFLKSRLNFTGDYYVRNVKDILLSPILPGVAGLGSAEQNLGEMQSKGWEISLTWKDQAGAFSYGATFNLSDSKNVVKNLAGTPAILSDAIRREGDSKDALYGWRVDRIAQESDFNYDPAAGKYSPKFAIPVGDAGSVGPGDLMYKDLDKSGDIDDNDREVIGSMTPRYTFGFRGDLAWKGIDFSFFLQGVGKADGYIYGEAMHPFINDYAKPQNIHRDRWTPENPNASYPRLTSNKTHNLRFSDYWLQDASYLRLKNVSLGYTLPQQLTQKIGINRCRFYVSAENLFTASDYFYAYDPETILNNGSFYPQLKTFYFGLNVNF